MTEAAFIADTVCASVPHRHFVLTVPRLNFIADVLAQVSPKGVPLVRYCGWYSNKNCGHRRHATELPGNTPTALPSSTRPRSHRMAQVDQVGPGSGPIVLPAVFRALRQIAIVETAADIHAVYNTITDKEEIF